MAAGLAIGRPIPCMQHNSFVSSPDIIAGTLQHITLHIDSSVSTNKVVDVPMSVV